MCNATSSFQARVNRHPNESAYYHVYRWIERCGSGRADRPFPGDRRSVQQAARAVDDGAERP